MFDHISKAVLDCKHFLNSPCLTLSRESSTSIILRQPDQVMILFASVFHFGIELRLIKAASYPVILRTSVKTTSVL
jgi:hypothetical protein